MTDAENSPDPPRKRPTRTERQNRALHKYFDLLSKELNEGGFNVQVVLKEKLEVDWTPDLVKELLWRTAQKVILGKKSTKQLNKTEDITVVYEHLNRHLGEKFGVHVEFPRFEDGEYERITSNN